MLKRSTKQLFYLLTGPLMSASSAIYRSVGAPRSGPARAHLGPGQKKYLQGWINLDANIVSARCDVWADLRSPLPFHDRSLDAVYSHHMVEHLPNLESHFAEVFRCLKPGGVYRVAGPNGDAAIAKFVDGQADWFWDWPDRRASIGGRFENFVFCRGEHLTILTQSYLRELMTAAGFGQIDLRLPVKETGWPDLFGDAIGTEHEDDYATPHTLVLEAVRPQ